MTKNILIFDDDVLTSFKDTFKPKVVQSSNWYLRWDMMYWMQIFDCTKKEKKFIRYMFHKKRRIQKKWDKIFNDRYRKINTSPFAMTACV